MPSYFPKLYLTFCCFKAYASLVSFDYCLLIRIVHLLFVLIIGRSIFRLYILFNYLGLLFGANMPFKRNWLSVVERVRNRPSSWKSMMLSIGGRRMLSKSVLGSLPIYYFSLFKAPKSILYTFGKYRRRFL